MSGSTPWSPDWEKSFATASSSTLGYSISDVDAGFAVGDVNDVAAIYLSIPSWSVQDSILSARDLFLLTGIPQLAEQLGLVAASTETTLTATAIAVDQDSQTAQLPVFAVLEDDSSRKFGTALLELPARSSLKPADLSLDQFSFYSDLIIHSAELLDDDSGTVVAGSDLNLTTDRYGSPTLVSTATRLRFDHATDQDQSWTETLESGLGTQYGDLAKLSNGDLVITGLDYASDQSFGDVQVSKYDINIARYDASGTRVWPANQLSTAPSSLVGKAWGIRPQLAVDSDDNIYLGASVFGTYGPFNPAGQNLDRAIGITKYAPNGNELWKYRLGDGFALSSGTEDGAHEIRDLLIAPDGSVLVLGTVLQANGSFHGTTSIGDGTDRDAFITALSSDGERLWTHRFGSADVDLPSAFAFMPLDQDGTDVNTLVVVGEQQSVDTNSSEKSRGWVHLLDYNRINSFYQQESQAPLSQPQIDWALVTKQPDESSYSLDLSGQATPDSSIELFYSLASDQASSSSTFQRLPPVTVNQDGLWQINADLSDYTPPTLSNQASRLLLFADSGTSGRTRSDSELTLITPEGFPLPGQTDPASSLRYPEAYWIKPSDVGVSSPRTTVPLLRSVLTEGNGDELFSGQMILADYTGTLMDGTIFDSSLDPGDLPFGFVVGTGNVISGWHYGLLGGDSLSSDQDPVRMGSELQLTIPAELAYWDRASSSIPAYSSLQFDINPRVDLTLAFYWMQYLAPADMANISSSSYAKELIALGLGNNPNERQGHWLNLSTSRSIYDLKNTDVDGPFNGSNAPDIYQLTAPSAVAPGINPDVLEWGFPLTTLGAAGNDQLTTSTTSGLFFGESGDDLINAGSSSYSYLDGGEGNDTLEIGTSPLTWSNGGSGSDVLRLSSGRWELVNSISFLDSTGYDPVYKLGQRDLSDPDRFTRVSYVQSIEKLEGITELQGRASELIAFLKPLVARSQSPSELKLIIEDTTLTTDQLIELLGITSAQVDVSALTSFDGILANRDSLLPIAKSLHKMSRLIFPPVSIPSLTAPRDGIYSSSDTLDFSFKFAHPVAIDGQPQLSIGNAKAQLNPDKSDLGNGVLVFTYSPDPDHDTSDLKFSKQDLLLGGGDAIYDSIGRQITTLVDFDASISIQTSPRLLNVHSPGGTYLIDKDDQLTIPLSLEFSEPVALGSSSTPPQLLLNLGSQTVMANHVSSDKNIPSRYQGFDVILGSSARPSGDEELRLNAVISKGGFEDLFGLPADLSSPPPGLDITVSSNMWNLDVDKDGKCTALGDGLMIVRYLFSSAFHSDTLVADALSRTSIYQPSDWQDIVNNIKEGDERGLLDVDRDGETTALGDGLMIVRHLFGGFRGEALTADAFSGSASLESSLLGSVQESSLDNLLVEQIKSNIDQLVI